MDVVRTVEHTGQRERILAAAERLFAERGVDAVSLRAVMAAAGTNVASVHYHFGSKDALIGTLVRARSDEVARRRTALLDELEAEPEPSVHGLAAAFVRPVAELALGGDESWVRLVDRIVSARHPALEALTESFAPQGARMVALLGRLRPDATPATVRFRLAQAMTLTFRVLADLDGARDTVARGGAHLSPAEIVGELTGVVASILGGPPETPCPPETP
jgi:AcrR family transcriptional regulator